MSHYANFSSKCLINHSRAWNEGSRVLWSYIHRRGEEDQRERERVQESTCCRRIPEIVTRWWMMTLPTLQNHLLALLRQGFPQSLTHSIYWAETSLKDRILPALPGTCCLVMSPLFRTLFPDGAGWGRRRPSPAEWRPAQCDRGALMTVRGCSGETVVHLDKNYPPLSSRSISLSSCAVLFSSRFYVKKRQVK